MEKVVKVLYPSKCQKLNTLAKNKNTLKKEIAEKIRMDEKQNMNDMLSQFKEFYK